MSNSTAWSIESLSPTARQMAELAAERAGVTLHQWLDQAIAERAIEADPALDRAAPNEQALRDATAPSRSRETPNPNIAVGSRKEDIVVTALHSIDSLLGQVDAASAERRWNATAGWVASRAAPGPTTPQGAPDVFEKPSNAAFQSAAADRSTSGAQAPRPFDLESAVSEIASRRRALDAHLAHDGLAPNRRDPAGATDRAAQPESRPPPREAGGAPVKDAAANGSPIPTDDLRLSLLNVSGMLDALRREWSEKRPGQSDVALLQDQVAAMRRRLADMAPIAVVAALEQSLGDLAQRVTTISREGCGETLLPAMDRIAGEVREALKAYDPKVAAAELERRIDSIGASIDALADATVRPEAIEPVRRQMAEVHDLLIAAAERCVPFERLEGRIADLAERIDGLAADAAQRPDSMDVAELLATLRSQAAVSAEPRAAQSPDLSDFDARARSVEGALARSQTAAASLESSLTALTQRLDAVGAVPVATLIDELHAKLDALGERNRERRPIEPILMDILDRLDGQQNAAGRLAAEIVERLEGRLPDPATIAAIPGRMAEFGDRLDVATGRLSDAEALERAARDLIARLEEPPQPVKAEEPATDFVEQIAALREERLAADRRTEEVLQGVQDVLDRLIDRLAQGDERPTRRRKPAGDAETEPRVVSAAALAALTDIGPRPLATKPSVGDERAPSQALEDEFLLEPGAKAPRPPSAEDPAQAAGARTSPAVSAHIAAARRAAQSAVAEAQEAELSTGWRRLSGPARQAKAFCGRRRRAILVAATLALAIAAAARLAVTHGPLIQKSDLTAPAANKAAELLPHPAPSAVDLQPTASIGPHPATVEPRAATQPDPADLPAAIPDGVEPGLRAAVLAGSPAAQSELAQRLLEGRGVAQDQGAAALWLERAASAGFAPAASRLGALYQKGAGVARDPAAAKRWYLAAAEAGNARAAHNLAVMEAEPSGDKADYVDGVKWFRRAAELGVRDSQYNLGVLYARGLGVDQDLGQSWIWFSLAAAQGDDEAARKRDEVAAQLTPAALVAASDALAKVKIAKPDPVANDLGAASGNAASGTPTSETPANPAPPTRDEGPKS